VGETAPLPSEITIGRESLVGGVVEFRVREGAGMGMSRREPFVPWRSTLIGVRTHVSND